MSEKIKGVLAALVIAAFGIGMIANPDLMDGAEASGRRSIIKQVLIWIWSMPAGIILTILGAFIGYGVITTDDDERAEEN